MELDVLALVRDYGPGAGLALLVLWWLYRRLRDGKITITSATAAELEALIVARTTERDKALEAERDARRCEQHQREIASAATEKLVRYLESSQRLPLVEVEAAARKMDAKP